MKKNCENCGYCTLLPKKETVYRLNKNTGTTTIGQGFGYCNCYNFMIVNFENENNSFIEDCPYFSTIEEIAEEDSFREEIRFEELTV